MDPLHFGVWGVDMGGYVALKVAEKDHRVSSVVVDDAYSDPRDMAQVQIENSGLTVLPWVGRLSDAAFRLSSFRLRHEALVSDQRVARKGFRSCSSNRTITRHCPI